MLARRGDDLNSSFGAMSFEALFLGICFRRFCLVLLV